MEEAEATKEKCVSRYLGRSKDDPDYGLGEHTIDCDRLGLMDERELTGRLVRAFEAPGYVPPRLPAVAMELMTLSQNPDVEFREIESLLEQDAVLAGEVLSLARSAFYSRARQVGSLREALVRLGLVQLRQVVMEAAMNMRVFRSASYRECMERLRDHCRATAHLCRIVSSHTTVAGEQVFLCGLLHDVGIAGILLVLGDVDRGKKAPDLAVLWPAIDSAHARAGTRMVALWGLPPEIAVAVGAHHQVSIKGFDHPLAATVCLAEALAAELSMAFVPPEDGPNASTELEASGLTFHGRIDRSDAAIVERAREALSLDEAALEQIRSEAREWAQTATNPADD